VIVLVRAIGVVVETANRAAIASATTANATNDPTIAATTTSIASNGTAIASTRPAVTSTTRSIGSNDLADTPDVVVEATNVAGVARRSSSA
jgi:hypothetical protein